MDDGKTKKVRLNVDCSPKERRMVRVLAAKQDKTISKYLLDLLRKEIEKEAHYFQEEVHNN